MTLTYRPIHDNSKEHQAHCAPDVVRVAHNALCQEVPYHKADQRCQTLDQHRPLIQQPAVLVPHRGQPARLKYIWLAIFVHAECSICSRSHSCDLGGIAGVGIITAANSYPDGCQPLRCANQANSPMYCFSYLPPAG